MLVKFVQLEGGGTNPYVSSPYYFHSLVVARVHLRHFLRLLIIPLRSVIIKSPYSLKGSAVNTQQKSVQQMFTEVYVMDMR